MSPGMRTDDLWSSVPDESLTIVDRNFLAANTLMPLEARGNRRHWLTRARSTTKWTAVQQLGRGDSLVELQVSDEARRKNEELPKTWLVRAIEYLPRGTKSQVLLTSLTDAEKYPADEVAELYHPR